MHWPRTIARMAAITACVFGAPISELRAQSEPNWRELQRAERTEGLRGAARVAGEFVSSVRFDECVAARDVEALASSSAAIVVGQIGESRPYLSADGRIITTDFGVTVLEALKGPVSMGDTIIVSIPGGKILFDDGTSAELRPAVSGLPDTGERYLFFLERSRYSPSAEAQRSAGPLGIWSPTLASQGVFLVTDQSRMKPAARDLYRVAAKYRDADYATFMADIYSALTATRR